MLTSPHVSPPKALLLPRVNGTFTGPGQSLSTPTATNAAFDAISFEGTVGIAVNTTGAAAQLDIVTDILDDGTPPEVIDTVDIAGEIGTTYARVDIADATLTVLDNVLTADRLSFAKSGANIDVSGVNLDLAINAGTTRVLGLANADFALRFTEDGVAGALRNADVLGPDLGDEFEISGTVSAEFNTTNTDQTLDIDSTPVLVVAGTGRLRPRNSHRPRPLDCWGNHRGVGRRIRSCRWRCRPSRPHHRPRHAFQSQRRIRPIGRSRGSWT